MIVSYDGINNNQFNITLNTSNVYESTVCMKFSNNINSNVMMSDSF